MDFLAPRLGFWAFIAARRRSVPATALPPRGLLSKAASVFFFGFLLSAAPSFANPTADADQIREALTPPAVTEGDWDLDRDELAVFYAARDNKPAWNFAASDTSGDFPAFVKSLEELVAYHGLVPQDYPFDLLRQYAAPGGEGGLKLELLVTDTLLRLAHDLHGEGAPLEQLYPGWNFARAAEPIAANLAAAVSGNSVNEYIQSLAPKNPGYTALAKALKDYRAMGPLALPPVEAGGSLKPGDHDRRVIELRQRLVAEGYLAQAKLKKSVDGTFDDGLATALISWQSHHGLTADGHVGPKTVDALNVPLETRIDQIRANMERMRHMPDDFPPPTYALVNIPDATLQIWEDGKLVFKGDVIVGRVDRKTPFIQSAIRSMIINPSWHVPSKIAKADILPKLRKDPHYLEKLGFVISGSDKDPYGDHIDWASMPDREFNFRLRQAPGDLNSLGRLKFDFDNDFAVYLHGTPHQELFKKTVRDLSSGCVRLRDPEQVAEILLAGNKDPWSIDRIRDAIAAEKTRWVGIGKPLPLFILYWTAFAEDDEKINFREDVYGYDDFLIRTMNGEKIKP